MRTYAAENETTAVKAMLLNPGPLRTGMRRSAMPGEDPETLRTPEDLAPHFVRLAARTGRRPASSTTSPPTGC